MAARPPMPSTANAWSDGWANCERPALLIVPLRASELTRWVADNQADERDPAQLRARYAADLGRDLSRTIAWPPGRNEPCWCGSGRKYKKCCAAPGSGGSR